ncbi:MAG: IclR family transcriptional regulator domain-containing protein, partial [Planctomycetota bacterium]|jgi:DNA-binding IclR family transcriptional regulator
MVEMELVSKGEEGYSLGEESRVLARGILGQASREERLRPVLEALAQETGESSAYYEIEGDRLHVRAKVEMPESFHYMPVGGENQQPLHGFRIAVLPHVSPKVRRALIARATLAQGDSTGKLEEFIEAARTEGVAYETAETATGFYRLAAPVFLRAGRDTVGSIGITFAKGRYRGARLAYLREAVVGAAQEASARLGD